MYSVLNCIGAYSKIYATTRIYSTPFLIAGSGDIRRINRQQIEGKKKHYKEEGMNKLMGKKSKQKSRCQRNPMFNKRFFKKEIEVINNSSYDLEIEVVGVPVAKDMTKRESNISMFGVIKQQPIVSGIQQQPRTISKRHILKKNIHRGFLIQSFDIVCVRIYVDEGNMPIREEKLTRNWVWTITDDSLHNPTTITYATPLALSSGPNNDWVIGGIWPGFIGALIMGLILIYLFPSAKSPNTIARANDSILVDYNTITGTYLSRK